MHLMIDILSSFLLFSSSLSVNILDDDDGSITDLRHAVRKRTDGRHGPAYRGYVDYIAFGFYQSWDQQSGQVVHSTNIRGENPVERLHISFLNSCSGADARVVYENIQSEDGNRNELICHNIFCSLAVYLLHVTSVHKLFS